MFLSELTQDKTFFLYLSFIIFLGGLFLYKKTKMGKIGKTFFFLISLVQLFVSFFYFIVLHFTKEGINSAVVYHLRYGLSGAGFLEYRWLMVGLFIYIVLALFFCVWIIFNKHNGQSGKKRYFLSFLLVFLSFAINPASRDFYDLYNLMYGNNANAAENFYAYYERPSLEKIGKNKNLVFIYAEGLEETYFDEKIFPGLIKGLKDIRTKSIYFTDIKEVEGVNCTIAGAVASQCGIPLSTPTFNASAVFKMKEYLPSAKCAGDLLSDEGYNLSYYGGADITFAGKDKFYETHGFDEIVGRDYLFNKMKDKSYINSWGIYDDTLLDFAYNRFEELSSSKDKFALYTLTLDTHHPKGHISKKCDEMQYQDGKNPILNAVACSDYLISEFVNKIMNSKYKDDTVVVIASDHLAHLNTAWDLLESGQRRNMFMILDSSLSGEEKVTKNGSHLDIFPTIAPFIGFKSEMGLGRNLLDEEQSIQEIGKIQNQLQYWNKNISRFWNFPVIENFIEFDPENAVVKIDDIKFDIPVVIEINEKMETNIKVADLGISKLRNYVSLLGSEDNYLFLDNVKGDEESGYYLIAGKGRKIISKTVVDKKIKLTIQNIKALFGFKDSFNFDIRRIAHAGGGISGKTYTNSFEAIEENFKKGFSYFEIDFSFTKDNQLACIHDWDKNFETSFGFEIEDIPTLKEFEKIIETNSKFHNCTLNSLADFMEKHPEIYIITDVKADNLKALQIISEKIKDYEKRIIPQIYDPANYSKVKKMGYEQIIWTLYRYNFSTQNLSKEVLSWTDKFEDDFAITMPEKYAKTDLPIELFKKKIPTYVHTINDSRDKDYYLKQQMVSEIYTDFLPSKN
jgi:phosphoglycerol transferase